MGSLPLVSSKAVVNFKFPVHPLYNNMVGKWKKCRDIFEGSEVVKAAGSAYLPRLTNQSDDEYNAYKERALFYPITGKTVSALVGLAVYRDPFLKYPDLMAPYFKDTGGLQFYEYWCQAIQELLLLGRYGVLCDAPAGGGEPYLSAYCAESIINWQTDESGNLTMVLLVESTYERSTTDEFTLTETMGYRALRLVNGEYEVEIYNAEGVSVSKKNPTYRGKTLSYIPFFLANPYGISGTVVKPSMLDIVNINISHYHSSADLEHGRHFTGLPTPVAIGVDADTILKIGSMTAWVIPDPQGDAKYLEFTGQGLQSLENAMKEKQSQLASMSARFIDNSTRGSEAVDAVRLRYMMDAATLAVVIRTTNVLFNLSYKVIAEMKGLSPDEVQITMNTNILSSKLSSKEVKELVESYIDGGISEEVLIYNLRQGEIVPPDFDDSKVTGDPGKTKSDSKSPDTSRVSDDNSKIM